MVNMYHTKRKVSELTKETPQLPFANGRIGQGWGIAPASQGNAQRGRVCIHVSTGGVGAMHGHSRSEKSTGRSDRRA